jgi:hypothetical protein
VLIVGVNVIAEYVEFALDVVATEFAAGDDFDTVFGCKAHSIDAPVKSIVVGDTDYRKPDRFSLYQ